jgi:hypothetical protein
MQYDTSRVVGSHSSTDRKVVEVPLPVRNTHAGITTVTPAIGEQEVPVIMPSETARSTDRVAM